MVFKNPKLVKVKLALQAENPQEAVRIVADYIFGDEHEESDVSWLPRVADRYSNGSSYTSISEYLVGEETPSSKNNVVVEDDGAASIKATEEDNWGFRDRLSRTM